MSPSLTRSHGRRFRLFAKVGPSIAAGLALLALAGCETMQQFGRPPARAPLPSTQTAPSPTVPPAAQEAPAPLTPPAVEGLAPGKARVALLLPLSGTNADLGQSLLNAAELALFLSQSDNLELLPRDTEGPGGATAAATAALNDGAELVLGPIFAASTSEIAPLARARGVPVISFSWRATSTPSLVETRSGSMISAPSSMAFWYEASVCSGRNADAPRWPITWRVAMGEIGRAHV